MTFGDELAKLIFQLEKKERSGEVSDLNKATLEAYKSCFRLYLKCKDTQIREKFQKG